MQKGKKYTGIIILNYNNSQMTIDCLKSLNNYINSYCKILVVDNDSSSKEKELLKHAINTFKKGSRSLHILEIKELYLKKNLWYACWNSEWCKIFYQDNDCEDILILNNDTIFIEDILISLKTVLWRNKDTAWVMPRLINAKYMDETAVRSKKSFLYMMFYLPFVFFNLQKLLNIIKKLWIYRPTDKKLDSDKIDSDSIIPCEVMHWACFLVKKDDLKSVDDFDSRTFLYFEEDILWCKFEKIHKLWYLVTSAKIIHLWGESSKKMTSYFLDVCIRNSSRIYIKYYLRPWNIRFIIFNIFSKIWLFIDWIYKSRKIDDFKKI